MEEYQSDDALEAENHFSGERGTLQADSPPLQHREYQESIGLLHTR